MSDNWRKLSAVDLGRGIEAGQIDPVVLTDSFLDAISSDAEGERIYARTTGERALTEARAARTRAKSGLRRSPLDGVPISWKDLFDTAQVETEAGSALLKGRIPVKDAEVLRRATSSGLICLGKTHMTELAFSGLGINPVTKTPPCINDPDAAPGGSSSGAATSVAFGLASAGIGSDTGGSVRVPAAWNDLVGLKTTLGRLPMEGVVPLCPRFDTVGPLTRTVADAAAIFAVLDDSREPDLAGSSVEGLNLMVLTTSALEGVRDGPAGAFEEAREKLSKAGAKLTLLPHQSVADALALTPMLYAPEAYGLWKDQIEAEPDLMFGEVRDRFRAGADVSAPDYVAAWERLKTLRIEYLVATAGFDAVLAPTSPILPPNADRLLSDHDFYVTENLLALRNTRIANLLDLCALTLPTGTPSAGLMIMAPPMDEARLLRIGSAIEKILT